MNDISTERAGRSVSLTWYGQAGFRLAAGDSRVLIDPFLTDRDDRNYRPDPTAARPSCPAPVQWFASGSIPSALNRAARSSTHCGGVR